MAVRGAVGVAKAQQDSAERKKGSVRRAQKYRRVRECVCGGGEGVGWESSAKLKGLQSRFDARGGGEDGKREEDGVEQKLREMERYLGGDKGEERRAEIEAGKTGNHEGE